MNHGEHGVNKCWDLVTVEGERALPRRLARKESTQDFGFPVFPVSPVVNN